jgi:hypothetical protein
MAEIVVIGGGLKRFMGFRFLGASSEKGSTRKHTEKWVTRCGFCFRGNFRDLRCFTKRIKWREFKLGLFWRCRRGSTWR